MKKFIGIYFATPEKLTSWAEVPPEDQNKSMEEWNIWMENHKSDITDIGNPLGKNMRVEKGSVAEVKNGICGYSVVHADSHENAAKVFVDCPHTKEEGAWIDVLEMVTMPSM